MKLASLKSGRDGKLVVVSRDAKRAVSAATVAPTLQAALDAWETLAPKLDALSDLLNAGDCPGAFELDLADLGPPLPRSFQYLDGASYHSHILRNRKARGSDVPEDFFEKPLVYQGISHGFMGWNDPIDVVDEAHGVDFEAEIGAITDDVPVGVTPQDALGHIKLFVLLNDISLRQLIPAELARSFGFLVGKPHSTLGPFAVTTDELGDLWKDGLVAGRMTCHVRGEPFGNLESGKDTPYHYGHLISHVAKTRTFEPGTIVGLGTISNTDESAGCGCIGEKRALETLSGKTPSTPFLKSGDGVRIEHFDTNGHSVFGRIEQTVRLR